MDNIFRADYAFLAAHTTCPLHAMFGGFFLNGIDLQKYIGLAITKHLRRKKDNLFLQPICSAAIAGE